MAGINLWQTLINSDLSEYTLIVPSVAVGNVAQLACDLLISSLDMKKIESVYSPALVPMSGYDPYNLHSGSLSGCCELYQCESKHIIIMQLRAPLVYKYSQQFLTEVVDKFKAKNIKDIIILTSSFAHEKKHVLTSPFRYVVSELCPYQSKLKSLEWVEHEPKNTTVKIFGGGFASLLYEITTQKGVPCLVLYKFSSEGDNIPDAYEMVQYINCILSLFKEDDLYSQLVRPVSWNLLFGRPPPVDIY